jgi:hypothetical protein
MALMKSPTFENKRTVGGSRVLDNGIGQTRYDIAAVKKKFIIGMNYETLIHFVCETSKRHATVTEDAIRAENQGTYKSD